MATDPTISLHAGDGVQQQGGAFGQLGGILDTVGKMNQVKLFQQSFAARQKAGAILASAPDLQTGLDNLAKDPDVNAFAPELVNDARSRLNAQAAYEGTQQDQRQKGLEGGLKAIVAAGPDPVLRKAAVDGYMNTLSPGQRKIMQAPMDNLVTSLTQGLPDDPVAAKDEISKRAAALGTAVGMTQAPLTYGEPGIVSTGGSQNPIKTDLATGQVTATGAPVAMTQPPTITDAGKVPIGGVGASGFPSSNPLGATNASAGAGGGRGGGSAALGVTTPQAAAIARANSSISKSNGGDLPAPDGGDAAAPTAPLSYTGKPLWDSDSDFTLRGQHGVGTGGVAVKGPLQMQQAADTLHEYNTDGLARFKSAQTSLAGLETINSDLDNLNKIGGFSAPGAAGGGRAGWPG